MEEKEMTAKELAAHYKVSLVTIYDWCAKGMPGRRGGPAGRWRFILAETDEWRRQNGVSGPQGVAA